MVDAAASERVYARIAARLIPFLLLCLVISYVDRVNIGFAKLQMLGDLGLSETVYGLGAGVFFVGYALCEIPSNLVMMRVGPRVWIGRIMVSWGIVSACMVLTRGTASFYLLRFLLGIAEAGFIPAILYTLTVWFPPAHRGRAMALFLAGVPLSGIIGGPLAGLLMSGTSHPLGLAGWRWMFLVEGLSTVAVGIACFLFLDDDVASARWLSEAERRAVQEDVARGDRGAALHTLRDGLASGRVWLLSATYFFFAMGLYGISFWLPTIVRDSGVKDPLHVGLLTAVPYAGALVTMILVGRSSDRRRERRWHLAVPALVGAAGLVASVAVSGSTLFALAALTVAAAGALTCVPQFYILAPTVLAGPAAATGLALANSVGSAAGFVSPYLLGWVKDATGVTGTGVLVLAAALVVGAALVFANPARMVDR